MNNALGGTMAKQVKSKQRVADHGEVFTAEREVKAMCDLVADEPAPYGAKTQQPKKEEEPKVNLSGAKEGALVIHKAFGEGTITKIDKAQKHIRVKFKVGEKTFLFPDAFIKGFLKMKE